MVVQVNNKNQKTESQRGNAPATDGVDHINIHPRAHTSMGRMLSSYRHLAFVHPAYGPFHSIEGFNHYLRTGCKNDSLRYVSGFKAKVLGREFDQTKSISNSEYLLELAYANYQKILQNPQLLAMVVATDLPFDSYYIFKGAATNGIVVEAKNVDWVVKTFTEIREALKKGTDPESFIGLIEKYRKETA